MRYTAPTIAAIATHLRPTAATISEMVSLVVDVSVILDAYILGAWSCQPIHVEILYELGSYPRNKRGNTPPES
jgi:hypothetical protein